MVPLKTIQGLSSFDLQTLINSRDVYVWGTGILAHVTLTSLKASKISIKGFLDNRETFVGKKFEKHTTFHIDEILKNNHRNKIFIIISSSALMQYAKEYLKTYDFVEDIDFISYIKLSRPTAAVDIYSGCNVKCTSCPQGNMNNLREIKSMSFDNYKLVLNKLLKGIPLLSCIELFTWGEPLLNKELPNIIKYTKKKEIPSILSTNLQNIDILEETLKEEPTALYITVNDVENGYERHMKGASWKILLNNLSILSSFVSKYELEIIIEVRIFAYKNTSMQKVNEFIGFCKRINLKCRLNDTYLNPYDNYLDICFGEEVSENARLNLKNNVFSFDKVLDIAKKDISLPCLSQRIFPIINANLSVGLCHTYYTPVIVNNFLEISWENLLKIRHNQVQCEMCQSYALHRFDLEVLKRKYFLEMNKIKGL